MASLYVGEETERHASVYNCVVRKTFIDAECARPNAQGLQAACAPRQYSMRFYRGEMSALHRRSSCSVTHIWVRRAAVPAGRVVCARAPAAVLVDHRAARGCSATTSGHTRHVTTTGWRL